MNKFVPFLFLGFLAVLACEKKNDSTDSNLKTPPVPTVNPQAMPSQPEGAPVPEEKKSVLAKINGQEITDAEISERVKDRLSKVESQIFEIKREGLDEVLEEKLLEAEAAKKGTSIDQLLKEEIEDKAAKPTDAEITAKYESVKKRLKGKSLEEVKGELIRQISQEKKSKLYMDLVSKLENKADIEIYMERPRIAVSTDDDPSKGSPGAPITIIEFSEYQCPFCKKARPVVQQILDTYKGKIHYVFRDFPLSFHQQARKASEAASCAGEQGKYWEYSDILWEKQGQHQPDKLKEYAKEAALSVDKFNKCLDSGKYDEEIEKDIRDGSKAGVSGTPAYFVNGIFISGAQPFEKFQEVIDEELKAKK